MSKPLVGLHARIVRARTPLSAVPCKPAICQEPSGGMLFHPANIAGELSSLPGKKLVISQL
jgi:hypothetical protein